MVAVREVGLPVDDVSLETVRHHLSNGGEIGWSLVVRDQVLRLPPTPNARKTDQTLWVLFTPVFVYE